ncbi:MAG: EamA/RhaT family transporter [Bacteroidetes bacterium]|nr:MAG: EamA/RhaT family transporter [Bacteroidota bacterium]
MSRQQKAYLLALIAILLWSTAGSAFKLTLEHISSAQLLLYASFFSLLFLTAWKAVEGNLILSFKISQREYLNSAIMGLLNPFAYYIILFEAYDLLLAQEAVALNYVWPLTLVLLSIPVLKQRISLLSVLAILISFAGMLVIIMKGSFGDVELSSPRGIFFALISSFFWASYWLMNMKDKREEVSKLLVNFVFGFFYVLIYVFVTGVDIQISMEGIGGSIYVGLFEMGLTYVLWLKALQLSSTTAKVSNLVYISPFLSLMFVSVAVGETIYLYTIGGLALIVGGIVLQRLVK